MSTVDISETVAVRENISIAIKQDVACGLLILKTFVSAAPIPQKYKPSIKPPEPVKALKTKHVKDTDETKATVKVSTMEEGDPIVLSDSGDDKAEEEDDEDDEEGIAWLGQYFCRNLYYLFLFVTLITLSTISN